MTDTYRLHGLDIASPYPLGHRGESACPDITVTVEMAPEGTDHSSPLTGRRVAHLTVDRPYYELVDRGADGQVFRYHGLVDVLIPPDQRQVRCLLLPEAEEAMLPVILAGNVISSLLLLRGECVLHASAVECDGQAVALVGRSQSGKSTLAALAALNGARLVTDDVLRVVEDSGGLVCHRGGSDLRLRPSSKALAEAGRAVVQTTADGRHLLRAPATPFDTLAMRAVVFPRLRTSDHPLVRTRIEPKDALFTMLACPRVQNWEDLATAAAHFSRLASLAEHVPAYTLDLPWGVNTDASSPAALADALFADLS